MKTGANVAVTNTATLEPMLPRLELKLLLDKQPGTLCIPITFNCRQSLELDFAPVRKLTMVPEEPGHFDGLLALTSRPTETLRT